MTLPVSEVFGPTIQGEGPHAGMVCQFVRLGGCNLACSWCDTPYTWDASRFDLRVELALATTPDILDRLDPTLPVVLTGGEPLLHQSTPEWVTLLRSVDQIHVETNGTIVPSLETVSEVTHFTVSPKLANAGTHKGRSPKPWAGWNALPNAIFKFVVRDEADVIEALQIADSVGFPRSRTWVMPEGATRNELDAHWPAVVDAAIKHKVNATHRLHVLVWGDKRGV